MTTELGLAIQATEVALFARPEHRACAGSGFYRDDHRNLCNCAKARFWSAHAHDIDRDARGSWRWRIGRRPGRRVQR